MADPAGRRAVDDRILDRDPTAKAGIEAPRPRPDDRTLTEGMALLERDGITGKAVTPFLLAHFHHTTGGASLAVNVRIILRNAELAARIAVAAA